MCETYSFETVKPVDVKCIITFKGNVAMITPWKQPSASKFT